MSPVVKNLFKEIVRAVLAGALAALGLSSTGCITHGDNAAACLINSSSKGE